MPTPSPVGVSNQVAPVDPRPVGGASFIITLEISMLDFTSADVDSAPWLTVVDWTTLMVPGPAAEGLPFIALVADVAGPEGVDPSRIALRLSHELALFIGRELVDRARWDWHGADPRPER